MKKITVPILILFIFFCCATMCACGERSLMDNALAKCDRHWQAETQDGCYITAKTDHYAVLVHPTQSDVLTVDRVSNDKFDFMFSSSVADDGRSVVSLVEAVKSDVTVDDNRELYIVIGIPENWTQCDIKVETSLGFVQIEDNSFKSLNVLTSSGAISVDDCDVAKTVTLKTSSGKISANIDAVSADVRTTSGNIVLKGEYSAQVVTTSETGNIDVELDTQVVVCSSDSGAIKLDIDAVEISVIAQTGDVTGKIDANKLLYTIDVNTQTGTCNLENQTGNGTNKLYVRTSGGSIDIVFLK